MTCHRVPRLASLSRLSRIAHRARPLARRPERRLARTDDGRAVIEFIFLGILMLLPLLYLVLTMARLQAASFSASLAGREAGRAFVTADTDADGRARAEAAARLAFGDFGFDQDAAVTLTCDGAPCLRPEGVVRADVRIDVQLPLVPDFIADHVPSAVSVSSTHVASVDRFVAR